MGIDQAHVGPMSVKDSPSVVIFGAESSICIDFIETLFRLGMRVAASVLTGPAEWDLDGIGPVVAEEEVSTAFGGMPVVVPWVAPGWRRERFERACAMKLKPLPALVDPTAILPRTIRMGVGAFVNAGAVIGGQVELGTSVFVNRAASIGHHTRLGDYVTIGPGATIAARVAIGTGCFIGAGAAIASGVSIGANSVVGSGASVFRDLPANVLAVGNPYRIAKTGIAGYQGVGV